MKLKSIIVEDDPYFSKVLRVMLERSGHIEVVATFHSSEDFLHSGLALPDIQVVFLDIELPGINGAELGKELRKQCSSLQVVFVTGKIEYAADAFDIDAIDYLVKPFDQERLNRCISRVISRIKKAPVTITLKTQRSTLCLDITKILFIEKQSKYSSFYTTEGNYDTLDTIEAIEAKLGAYGFIRTHKSYIINPNYIKSLERWADRAYQVRFHFGEHVALVSRSHIDKLKKCIKQSV
ncbi:LytR/AlgR family response regulator transcription factor [Desulfotomaculum nigrificans]|uniref:LytR/AlgR family response regulator transcription factor n=1 Tax=Desulfotomaculum nigrificans TaxID=1565 RepID=UPI0001FAED19|nr:LytTR family DNA-binding domain-containing protein [Desulfotomaculum nigrificans]